MFFGGLLALIIYGALAFPKFNDYTNQHYNYWDLSVKSSSIEDKFIYIDQMVKSFEGSDLAGTHNAILYKNPSNSFDANFKALVSLRDRLQEIKAMDVSSFEYQTAISQITAQEQGEASDMLSVLQGCWFKQNHPLYWGWIAGTIITVLIIFVIVGGVKLLDI